MKEELTEIQKENINRLYELMDIRVEQFKQIYDYKWWENLIEDEMYKFLCQKLAEVRTMGTNIRIAVTDEEIRDLSIGLILENTQNKEI